MSTLIEHTTKLWERKFPNGSDWWFYCPGCKCNHNFAVGSPGYYNHNWTFNGDIRNPTFTPSLRITSNGCHLNLTNGMLIFHNDSPHEFKGKTVPMEDL